MSKLDKIILALDNHSKDEIFKLLDSISSDLMPSTLKIGMELFYKHGHEVIYEIHQRYNKDIFLDIKLHDIPNTVAKAVSSLQGLPIKMLTLHLSGGPQMLKHAVESRNEFIPYTKLLGVSYLTSLSHEQIAQQYNQSLKNVPALFENLFQSALETQIDGVVLSAHEIKQLKITDCENRLFSVCPGIKLASEESSINDQKRVMTPELALENGANYLVIGRSITNADNPEDMLAELS